MGIWDAIATWPGKIDQFGQDVDAWATKNLRPGFEEPFRLKTEADRVGAPPKGLATSPPGHPKDSYLGSPLPGSPGSPGGPPPPPSPPSSASSSTWPAGDSPLLPRSTGAPAGTLDEQLPPAPPPRGPPHAPPPPSPVPEGQAVASTTTTGNAAPPPESSNAEKLLGPLPGRPGAYLGQSFGELLAAIRGQDPRRV